MANGITVVVGIVGLVAGWLVSGYQRVGEKLTEERRAAYGSLLAAADTARRSPSEAPDGDSPAAAVVAAAAQAEMVSSEQMFRSGLVPAIVRASDGDDAAYEQARRAFLAGARTEALANSAVKRLLLARTYDRA